MVYVNKIEVNVQEMFYYYKILIDKSISIVDLYDNCSNEKVCLYNVRGPLCVLIVRTEKLHQVRDNDLIVTRAWLKKIYCVWLSISGSLRNKITMEVFN